MNRRPGSIVIALAVSLMLIAVLMVSIANAASPRPDGASLIRPLGPSSSGAIRISQVYGGGGNASATYKNDFIELFNIGTTSVTMNSWSVQYAAAAGSAWSSNITVFTATLAPGQYYLIQEGSGGATGITLPITDAGGSTNLSASAGKVALVNNATALNGTCPITNASVVDFIGYDTTANCSETANATGPSNNTTANIRKLKGCQDLDDNSKDFSLLSVNPRNTSSPINICGLSISKSAVAQTNYNSAFTYTLTITNATITATDVVITDLLPSNVTYVPNSASHAGDLLNGDTMSWTIATMTHTAIVSRTFVVTAPTTSGSIVNQLYRVSAGNITSDAFGSAITTTVLAPALGMIKTATPNSNVTYHSLVTYTLIVSNGGQADALNTFITDTLPAEVDFAHWITSSGAVMNTDQITWTGTISIGKAITFTFVVTHVGAYADVVTNTAQFDQIGGSGAASATFSVESGTPSLSISKTASPNNNVTYHGTVTYTLIVSNQGTADALNTLVTDTLPSEVDFAQWIDQPIGANPNSDQITWAGTISVGQPITFTFVVTHVGSYGDVVTNTAQFDQASGSGSASAVFNVVPALPSLSLAKAVTTIHVPVKLGDPITYTIVVTNSGPGDAIGVLITDVLPSGVGGANLNQTINISAGQRISFTLAAVVTNNVAYYGKSITNTVSFSHTSGSGAASAVITIEAAPPANISAIKFSMPNNQRVLPNSLVTYTIVLSNSGGISATVRITDVINSYTSVFSALNFTQAPSGTLKWSGVVTAGQSITLNFVARVNAIGQLAVGHTILNNAATIDDGVHAPFNVNAPDPPWLDVYGVYLPLVKKNS
ncbi:MAG TPA: lamin tail domain-containing protein [Anaerolineae bacterium]|nr:lamin tail domain-containing protein [Anaerolineae bacterium]